MLHVQATNEHIERRRHLRVPTWQSAELFLDCEQSRRVCVVLDRSSSGVQIELGETVDLPEQMIIQFSSEASQLVRRCWAAGTRAGMEFIGSPTLACEDADNGLDEGAVQAFTSPPGGLADVASQVAALLQQIESKLRDYLNVQPEDNAVFFSEIGSRTGGRYRHKVTIIAPHAEAAALRIEAALNNLAVQPPQRGLTGPTKRANNEERVLDNQHA